MPDSSPLLHLYCSQRVSTVGNVSTVSNVSIVSSVSSVKMLVLYVVKFMIES